MATLGYSFGEASKLSGPDSLSLDATQEAIYRSTGLGRVTGVSIRPSLRFNFPGSNTKLF